MYRDEVRSEGEEVVDHGVSYPSLREATLASRCPLTNGTSQFFYHGTSQMMPSGTPFLDNRLFDLFLTIPVRHLLRGDLVNRAIRRLAPSLADYPHGSGVVPVRYPFTAQRVGELATEFVQKHLLSDPEKPHTGGTDPGPTTTSLSAHTSSFPRRSGDTRRPFARSRS
jgi:asparagine synthase (glutamine-hydrolysing)